MESRAVAESLLVAAILSWAASCAWPWLRMVWMSKKLPGPPIWRLLLYAITCLRGPEMIFKAINHMIRTYGPVTSVLAVHKVVVCIASPEDARLVLNHPNVRNRDFHVSKVFDSLFDKSIITVKDDVARARRKMMLTAFSTKVLATYVEVFTRKGEELCERLDKLVGGQTFDVKDEFNILVADTVFETGIGSRMDWPREQWEEITKNILAANLLVFRRLTQPWKLYDWMYQYFAESKMLATSRMTIVTKLKQGFAKRNQVRSSVAEETDVGQTKHQSFTDIMQSTRSIFTSKLTEDQIREECMFMIGSSMETTGKTMSYALMMLGMHPEYQDQAVKEQRTIFGDSLRPATTEDIANMPILEHIIKETLRLFPPVSGLTRELIADVEITKGRVLPAGAMVLISNYMLHRDAANFEEPERFWPKRWEENSGERHPYAYIPFASGVRSCIGQRYAQLQMKTTLSRVLRQFRFTSGNTMRDLRKIEINLTNISAIGYKVEVFRRDKMLRKRDSFASEVILQHG